MSIDRVTKRNGIIVPFDRQRIENAIYAAARAVGNGEGRPWAEALSWAVVGILEDRYKLNGHVPHVEEIQDLAEVVLIKSGNPQVAKKYILYRYEQNKAREAERLLLDADRLVDDYIQRADWRVNENSNMNYSLQGLNSYLSSSIAARYWLHKIYPSEVQKAHVDGDLHLHDLGMLSVYCCGWDLHDLLMQGFGGVTAKIESKPPKHLRTALGQLVNFFYTLQGESAGAVAVSNFDTLLAPFIRYDGLDYGAVKQAMQEFVFNINVPTRVGFQSLTWDELVVVKRNSRVEITEIGQLVDEQFKCNTHRVLSRGNNSYAVENADDIQALAFNENGQAIWAPVKAFVRHRVPEGATFVRVRTSRGTAKVSQAHSLFAFEELNGEANPHPMAASDVEIVHGNTVISPTNHFIAIRQAPNSGTRDTLELVELIDAVPHVAQRTRVRLSNPAQAIERLRERVREAFGGFTPFYLEYGIKDKGCWKQWAQNGTLPYQVWRTLGQNEPDAKFALRNSSLWYTRTLTSERLSEFVRLLAWYITEGHNDITNGLYISQARGGDQKEIVQMMNALGALGYVEEMQGWSAKGNPTNVVSRMAGKGLLAVLIGYLGGTYSTNKIIPWFVYDLSPEVRETFIATLIKGDGSEYDKHFDYHTTSKKLSLGFSLLLAMNNYKFSVYETSFEQQDWNDQYILRIYKDKEAPERYAVSDLLARVCLRRGNFAYKQEYEYDLSVDTELENFAGGSGLLCFHNTPFTNVTMDLNPPSTLRDLPVTIGGEMQKETYGEFQHETDIFNRAFAEVMLEGDAKGRVFTFPIPTYNLTRDFDWDNAELEPIWAMTARYGIPYFCLEENTPVRQSDYTSVPIREVKVGTSLVDQNGSPVSVTAVHHSSANEIVHITQGNGQVLLATPTHRFPTNTTVKEAQHLSLGDNLIRSIPATVRLGALNATIPEKALDEFFDIYTILDDLEVIPVSPRDLLPGQTIILCPKPFPAEPPFIQFNHQANRYDSNRQIANLPERLTPDMCRMLGYLVGDGYYAKKNSHITFVSMDEATLKDYTEILESLGVNCRISQAGKSQVAKEISSHSVELREFFLQLGLHRVTARSKSVPWIIFRCPEEHVSNFVRGLFDADASVGKRRLIAFTSTSGILARQVQLLLMRMGIASHLSQTKQTYKITITGNNVRLYTQKVGSASQVKRERLEKHNVDNNRKSLGDPLLETQEQIEKLIAGGYLPYHYKRSSTYRGYYRVPSIALDHIIPGNIPLIGDYVAEQIEAKSELEPIVGLRLIKGDFNVVDVTVESDSHLFALHDGILSHNSNFINSDMSPDDARSMCCRLRLDQRELRKRIGGLFAAAPLTGSVGVVTMNMSRLGHLAKTEAEFLERLEELMEVARTSLEIKRNILEQFTERGLYPYCRHYLRGIKQRTGSYWGNHFSTIGLLGMNEASENLLGVSIAHPDGKAFAVRTLKFMREVLACFQEETGNLYNLEATPAEGASFRLARADRQHFSDIATGGTEETPYYTNSTQLPVSYTDDLFEALEHQDDLQTLYTGGTVLHIFQGEQLDDWRQARRLVRVIAERFRLPYYSLTPTFSICPVHGYISGKHEHCPYEHSEEELARFGRKVGN